MGDPWTVENTGQNIVHLTPKWDWADIDIAETALQYSTDGRVLYVGQYVAREIEYDPILRILQSHLMLSVTSGLTK